MNMNPNGTPQTSRWFDQVKAFTEAMGQPVGYDYSKAEKTLEIVRGLTGPTSAEDLERLLGSSAEDLERLLGSEGITVSDLPLVRPSESLHGGYGSTCGR